MKHVNKTQKILTKKFEIDKTMFENLLNHDISNFYTSSNLLMIVCSGIIISEIELSKLPKVFAVIEHILQLEWTKILTIGELD